MKKIISLLMALVLVLGVFTACKKETIPSSVIDGSESTEPSSSVTEPSSSPEPEPSESEAEKPEVNLGVLKGPTGIGASYLLEQNEQGVALNGYYTGCFRNGNYIC